MLSPNNEFACPTGCIEPEACAFTAQIRDLEDESRVPTPTPDQFERILCGDITPVQAKRETDYATRHALLGSCALIGLPQHQRH